MSIIKLSHRQQKYNFRKLNSFFQLFFCYISFSQQIEMVNITQTNHNCDVNL